MPLSKMRQILIMTCSTTAKTNDPLSVAFKPSCQVTLCSVVILNVVAPSEYIILIQCKQIMNRIDK